jgi:hypothetical protein
MGDKKAPDGSFATCFENMSFAQMKDMMAKKGVGTLCDALMKKAMKGQEGDWTTLCADMGHTCKDRQGHGPQRQEQESEGDVGESVVQSNRGPGNGPEEPEGNQR